jgi:two-component system, LuxR family, sensor kinase FixL
MPRRWFPLFIVGPVRAKIGPNVPQKLSARVSAARYLRDAAIFAPCYIALDWASYIDPVGPFNITPWNPQPALAIAWMMLGGLRHAPAVFLTIIAADIVVRHAPGGYVITALTGMVLAAGYAAIAAALRRFLADVRLRTTRQLTVFSGVVLFGAALVGAAFVGLLELAGLLGRTPFGDAWLRFWVGDAVGILVTAPLLLAAADSGRRSDFLALARRAEALLQAAVLAGTVWLIFQGLEGDPGRHFYLLFLPLIWIAVRSGMTGAILATGIVQLGLILGIHSSREISLSIVELQALLASLTLTGLFLGVMVDERQRAEHSLRQTLRLAAAGEMAGAIAHEVNQPLTALGNYGRSAQMLLARHPGGPPELQQVLDKMLLEADRAADVVRRLRDFFRAGTTRLEPIALAELLSSARRIAESAIGARPIALDTQLASGLPPLYIDRVQIELIFRNLLANAVDSLAGAPRADARVTIAAQRHGPGHVRITIADNGPGVPAATREAVFEPFVSGKATGMGLGLAVSRAIAEAHGGSLEAAHCAHGEFHLVLPCQQTA